MLLKSRFAFLGVALALGPAFVAAPPSFGQAAAAQATWKDKAESDLYEAITKENDPEKKIALFKQWKEKYPQSAMGAYFQPEYVKAITIYTQPVNALFGNPTPDQQAAGLKSAEYLHNNIDSLFATDMKPAQLTDAQWTEAKNTTHRAATNAVPYVAYLKKDYAAAETGFTKTLQEEPGQSQVSYWMANMLFAQKKYAPALFHYARAASYDGPGSLNEQGRGQVKAALEKTYIAYHGDKSGLDELLASAKTAALPPADLKIMSKREVAQAKIDEQNKKMEQLSKDNPGLALWTNLKEALTGDQAQSYFDEHMKGTEIPMEFKGKLIECKPAVNPKELVIAISDAATADLTVKLETPLRGKMDPGADIGIKNLTATAYTSNPFMVTASAAAANVTGWKGAPAAPVAPPKAPIRRAPVAGKK